MKKGDTLIEVMFAVGIFSMVAISAVSVMSLGMMNTQNALETTMARNEIDAQAESLRFIQSAYLAERESGETDGAYTQLWRKITRRAANGGYVNDATEAITKFAPTSCAELYKDTGAVNVQHAFVINGRKLADVNTLNDAIVTGNNKLTETLTSPRLYYSDDLVESLNNSNLTRAEGIYVVAVRDPGSNVVNEGSTSTNVNGTTYVDFYIRTCWHAQGNKVASSISTVIRLYDPDLQ